MPLLEEAGRPLAVDIGNHHVQFRLAGPADNLQRVGVGEEGVNLETEQFQQVPRPLEVPPPERVHGGDDPPEVHLPLDLRQVSLQVILHQSLQHQVVAPVGIPPETAGGGADDRHPLLPEVADHGEDIVADHLGNATGEHHVEPPVNDVDGIPDLLAEPLLAAEHDIVLLDVGTGNGQGTAVAPDLEAAAAVLGPGEVAGASRGGMEDGNAPWQRRDGCRSTPQGTEIAGSFDKMITH